MPDRTRHPTDASDPPAARLDVPAGLLAVALPGAGHALRGEVKRGLLIALGIFGLFITGLLTGGIDSIDSREDRLWFIGQAFVGPATFAVDALHQRAFKAYDADALRDHLTGAATPNRPAPAPRAAFPGEQVGAETIAGVEYRVWQPAGDPDANPDAQPPMRRSLAKVNELGALLVTLAGMLNFIALLDALIPGRVHSRTPASAR